MKKRFILPFITGLLCLSGCGHSTTSHPEQGELLDNKETLNVLRSINEVQQEHDSEEISKFTYSSKEIIDDTTEINMYEKFSKEDNYYYVSSTISNMPVYDGYEDEYKEYLGTIHTDYSSSYTYIKEGILYDVYHDFSDKTMRDSETDEFERKTDSDSYYEILSEDPSESEKLFHNDIIVQLFDLVSQLVSLSNQMLQQFEPLLESGVTSGYGVEIEVRSKGEGCLYLRESMPSQGMEYEVIYENYWLSKTIISMDYTKMGLTALGYKKSITETTFQLGVCDLTYPDLTNYELRE